MKDWVSNGHNYPKAPTLSPIEQLTLDFARLVAGKHDGVLVDDDLPDYPNDWNATIEAIEARDWKWCAEKGLDYRSAEIVFSGNNYIDDSCYITDPKCTALMRAAVLAAKRKIK